MFFVISGYCITASARQTMAHDLPTRGFMYRRLRRIYPPFWWSVLVVSAVPFVIEILSAAKTGQYVQPDGALLNLGYLRYSAWDWFSVLTLTRAFWDIPGAPNLQYKFTTINAVYWTLAIEVQFYLVVALALVVRRWFYPALLAVTALSIPTLFWPRAELSGIFLPYWPMFAAGVALYVMVERGLVWHHQAARIAAVILCSACAVALVAFHWQHTLSFTILLALMLWLGHGWDQASGTGRIARFAAMLGAMSCTAGSISCRFRWRGKSSRRDRSRPTCCLSC